MSEYNNPTQETEVEPEIQVVEPEIQVVEPEIEPEIQVVEPEIEPEIQVVEPEVEPEIASVLEEVICPVYWGTTYAMRKYVIANNPSAFKSGCPKTQYINVPIPAPTPPRNKF